MSQQKHILVVDDGAARNNRAARIKMLAKIADLAADVGALDEVQMIVDLIYGTLDAATLPCPQSWAA